MEVLEPRKHLGFSPLGSTNGILTGNNGGWQFTVGMRGGDCTAGETNRCSESTSKPVPGGGPHRAQRAAGLKTWAGSHDGGEVVQMTILLLSSFATTGKFSIPCPLVSSHQDGDDKRFCLSTVLGQSWMIQSKHTAQRLTQCQVLISIR